MTELSNHRDWASVTIATCRKELLQVQKNLATAHKNKNATFAHVVAVTKERGASTTDY